MVKYSRIYESGIEKHELIFRGTVFDFSMLPAEYGTKSDKEGFEEQIHKRYPDISVEQLEEIGAGDLWIEDEEDEIFDVLTQLGYLES